jgi:signal transduction histidine kinase
MDMAAEKKNPILISDDSLANLDDLTKPIQVEEAMAQVDTHLALRVMQKQLEIKNTQLARVNDELRREIGERIRLAEKLNKHYDHLEHLVEERTLELKVANEQLQNEITKRRQVEEELQDSIQKLKMAYQQATVYAQELTGEIVERKRTEAALRQYASQLETLEIISSALRKARTCQQIAQVLLTNTMNISQADFGILFLKEENLTPILSLKPNGEVVEQPLQPVDELIQQVACTGQPLFVPDLSVQNNGADTYQGMTSATITPLKAIETIVGVLHLTFRQYREFTEEEHHLLTAISEIAGNALHRSIVMETLEQRVADRTRELAALYDVTVLASGAQELEDLLEQSLEKILEVGKCEAVCIHLLDESEKELYPIAHKGIPPGSTIRTKTLSIQTKWGNRGTIRGNKPIIVSDLTTDSDAPPELRLEGFHSYLGAPMRVKGWVLGMLSLFWVSPQHLTLEEIVLLSTIADQMGVAVEISHLRQRVAATAVVEERQRLARELHDSVTQSLYGQTLLARTGQDALEDEDVAKVKDSLIKLGENALYALKEMRLLLYELRPSILEQEGLVRALSIRLDTVERRVGIKVQFQADELVRLSKRVEGELYRIAIEALNNALKHAEASLVSIHLASNGHQVELAVRDNGWGFNPAEVGEGRMGLKSMRERAEKLGGRLAITSASGVGTKLVVTIAAVE